MRKHTTIDLDTDLVEAAAHVLGTTRTTDTVHAALSEVVRRKQGWSSTTAGFGRSTQVGSAAALGSES